MPLDVSSGVSETGTCLSSDGPSVNVHLQKHPSTEGRYVNVLILQNYLSKEYTDKMEGMLNELCFQNRNSNSGTYMRIASQLPNTHITFGNSIDSIKLYEATEDIQSVELQSLVMSEHLQRLEDLVLKNAIEILQVILLEKEPGYTPSSSASERRHLSDSVDVDLKASPLRSSDGVFALPIGAQLPLDRPNAAVSHASRGCKPMRGHSDTRPFKPCNHDNDYECFHEAAMRIPTHCHVFSLDGSPIPDKVLTIRHGLPDEASTTHFCKQLGYFSSHNVVFVEWRMGEIEGIPMGGANHLHYQFGGSQGELRHYLDQINKTITKQHIRVILSSRRLIPLTEERQQRYFKSRLPTIETSKRHTIDGIVELIKGNKRVLPSAALIGTRDSPVRAKPLTKAKDPWESNLHRNGQLQSNEKFIRDGVIGIPMSYDTEHLMQHVEVARAMFKERSSLLCKHKSGKVSLVGSFPYEDESGNCFLLRPGQRVNLEYIRTLGMIPSSKQYKDVTSNEEDRCDILLLERGAKNSSSLLANVIAVLRRGGPLEDMVIRGKGGAVEQSGMYPVKSSSNRACREAPTHSVSQGQKIVGNKFGINMLESSRIQRVVNVFFKDVYIGPFWVKRAGMDITDIGECEKDYEKYCHNLRELHSIDQKLQPSPTPGASDLYEMMSMTSPCLQCVLRPMMTNFIELFKDNPIIPWNYHEVESKDFIHPSVHFPKAKIASFLGFGSFCNVSSILSYGNNLPFLSIEARDRLFPSRKNVEDLNDECAYIAGEIVKIPLEVKHIVCATLHSSGMTLAKTFEEDVVTCLNRDRINPPRKLLRQLNGCDEMDSLNLKCLYGKTVHPALLSGSFEPVIFLALASTDSFDNKKLSALNDDKQWRYRNGPGYLLNEHTSKEAASTIFKCIVCSIFSPSILLQIFHEGNLACAPDPNSDNLNIFMDVIRGKVWSSRILHANFSNVLNSTEDAIRFLQIMSEHCESMFQSAVRGYKERPEIVILVRKGFERHTNIALSDFHVHVIMRTVEACLHEPFGAPESVILGYGSKDGGECFESEFDCKAEQVPQKIVEHINRRAKMALQEKDIVDVTREQMETELLVLGLTWSEELDCLVHTVGIGKKFDACDSEHMLCMVYKMLQNTLPHRNVCEGSQMDGVKFFPIRCTFGDCLARELPIMAAIKSTYNERIKAYKKLLLDTEYEHRMLSDVFRIDVSKSRSDDD